MVLCTLAALVFFLRENRAPANNETAVASAPEPKPGPAAKAPDKLVAAASPVSPGGTPPMPKSVPALSPKLAPGPLSFGEPMITKTSFDPPSVEFAIRLNLAGGKLIEAWASVGITDAGQTLKVFAGALQQGLLEVNGINFANPSPSLKAQRVAMKRLTEDSDVYQCSVRYPKLSLNDPETEFTIVAALRKDEEIVKTEAVAVRVNLKSCEVLPPAMVGSQDVKPKPESDLQGRWRLTKVYDKYESGAKSYISVTSTHVMTVKDGDMTVETANEGKKTTTKYTVAVDTAKKPKQYTRTSTDEKRTAVTGIYTVEKNTLMMCFQSDGKPPEGFAVTRDDGKDRLIYEFERVQP